MGKFDKGKHLQQIKIDIKNSNYEDATYNCKLAYDQIKNITKSSQSKITQLNQKAPKFFYSGYQMVEIESIQSYCLIHLNRIDQAVHKLLKCLEDMPSHSLSHRRLGYAYEKQGDIEQALRQYKIAELYEPENNQLFKTILKLEKLIKKNSELNNLQIQLDIQNQKPAVYQNNSSSKQHVTFGSSQIIQMTSQNSDQYFANIKNQLTKLNHIKPKKSILKISTSLNKVKSQSASSSHKSISIEEKYQTKELSIKKTLSIKSCNNDCSLNWSDSDELKIKQQQLQIVKTEKMVEKKERKKKSISFSFETQQPQ